MLKSSFYNKVLLILLALIAIIPRLININFPFADYDEGVYIATIKSMLHGFPLIEKTYSSQFPLFIYISSIFYRISPTITSVRLVPVIFSLIIILVSYVLVKRYIGKLAAIFVCIYLSLNSLFLLTSRTFQIDIPWLSMTFLSFYFLMEFNRNKKREIYIILSSLAFTASILMKINTIFLPVLFFYMIYLFKDYGKGSWKYIGEYILVAAFLSLVTINPKDIILLYHQAVTIRTSQIGFSFVSTFANSSRQLLIRHELPMMIIDLSALVIYFVNFKKNFWNDRFISIVIIWLLVTSFILIIYNPIFTHHLVYFILPSTLLGAYFIQKVFILCKSILSKWILYLVLTLLIYYSMTSAMQIQYILFPTLSSYDVTLIQVAIYIAYNTKPNDYIISDDQILLYLSDRITPPNDVDTSHTRIDTKNLTTKQIIDDINKYMVKKVILVSNRLNTIPGMEDALNQSMNLKMVGSAEVFESK